MARPDVAAAPVPDALTFGVLRRHLRTLLFWPALGLALGLTMWALAYSSLEAEKRASEAKALKDTAALSKAYANYLDRTIEQIDQFTLYLKHDWETSDGTVKLEEFRRMGLFSGKYPISLSIFDRNGAPITSTSSFVKTLSVRDRRYFQFHQASGSDALLVGAPIVGRMNGKPFIPITRRLNAEDGSFKGVVLAAVDPELFFLTAPNFLLGETAVFAMVSTDGAFQLSRHGKQNAQATEPMLIKIPTISPPARLEGKQWFRDGYSRYVASQPLKAYPFLAIVGLGQQEVLLPYEQMRVHYHHVAIVISVLLFLFTLIATLLSIRLALRKERLEVIGSTYRLATEGAREGFYMYEAVRDCNGQITDFKIVDCNKRGAVLTGMPKDALVNKTLSEITQPQTYFHALLAQYSHAMESGFYEDDFKVPSASIILADWLHRRMVRSGDGLAVTLRDISDQKRHEEELARLATRDSLTGLPNMYWLRAYLPQALQHALALGTRSQCHGALMLIDLDNFKTLNGTLGHDKGDLLLQQIARQLKSCVRESDTVARLGGDEFVVLLENLSENLQEAAAEAKTVSDKIFAAFRQPYYLAEYEHISSPSIGITLFNQSPNTVDEIMKRADLAMYQAKAAGRNAMRFFDPEMQTAVSKRAALEADFRQGLQQREFFLHYQPQCDSEGCITGAEALVRWQSAKRGLVFPTEFISLAEETGLILPLGRWVLETACAQLAAWASRRETADLTMAVNVSPRQFRHPDFVQQVLELLRATGANPLKLKLELTESVLVDDVEDTIAKMNRLKAKGVSFSLDDFGTGYSSMSYLKRLPLDQLKIDKSFISNVLSDPDDAVIARTIVALGQSLGLMVIAEGVETEMQRGFLAAHGCHHYQGYLFSRPLPAAQFQALMQQKRCQLKQVPNTGAN